MGFGRLRFRRSFGQVKSQFRGARPKFYPLFTGLLDTYAGASAAYSLRRLSKIASSVVRVRRASDNAEKDFTADDITDSSMVNWVNGQIVPPLDIRELDSNGERTGDLVEAAAAYSLRNLSASYTGNVVDVRRSSDDAEDSFTAAEVADGTLEDWVNTDVVKYSSDFSSSLDGFIVDAGDTGLAGQTFEGESDVFKHTPSASTSSAHRIRRLSTVTLSSIVSLKVLVYIPSSNTVANGAQIRNVAGDVFANTSTTDEWVEIEATGTTGSGGSSGTLAIHATSGGSRNFTGNGTDAIYYKNVSVTVTSADGFVKNWYDQSGNDNHATQGTDASQPKIVDGGSLVSGGLDFDGVNDRLTCSSLYSSDISVFNVVTTSNTVNTANFMRMIHLCDGSDSFQLTRGGNAEVEKLISKNTAFQSGVTAFLHGDINGENLISAVTSSTDTDAFVDGSLRSNGSASGLGSGNNTTTTIGARDDLVSSTFFAGSHAELIIYPSDQSANRAAIETNINNQYDIY